MGNPDLVFLFITSAGRQSYLVKGQEYQTEKESFDKAFEQYESYNQKYLKELVDIPASQRAEDFHKIVDIEEAKVIEQIIVAQIS